MTFLFSFLLFGVKCVHKVREGSEENVKFKNSWKKRLRSPAVADTQQLPLSLSSLFMPCAHVIFCDCFSILIRSDDVVERRSCETQKSEIDSSSREVTETQTVLLQLKCCVIVSRIIEKSFNTNGGILEWMEKLHRMLQRHLQEL